MKVKIIHILQMELWILIACGITEYDKIFLKSEEAEENSEEICRRQICTEIVINCC